MTYFYFIVRGVIHCWAIEGYDESIEAFESICSIAFEFSGYSFGYQVGPDPA